MTRPRLLDLFCCAGGASMGYHRAGFDVYGIDIEPQPHYPHEFHQADALEYVAAHGHKFDAIAASPPCQALRRHRLFESNVWLYGAGGCQHRPITGHRVAGSYGGSTSKRLYNPSRRGGYVPTVAVRRALLGVDWPMNRHEINQAIPPAYTEFIGAQLLDQLVAA